jgi:tetratricopeptide (TPR) repeat protein
MLCVALYLSPFLFLLTSGYRASHRLLATTTRRFEKEQDDVSASPRGYSSQLGSSGRRVLLRKETDKISIELLQQTSGKVPRSYLPLFMNIEGRGEDVEENSLFSVIEESLQWLLDYGGRITQLQICAPEQTVKMLAVLGIAEERMDSESSKTLFTFSNSGLRQHCRQRLDARQGDAHALFDIIGRLEHDAGDPKAAIKSYTAALQVDSQISSTFRNLGSAYHATGDMQLAFASYQQAIQLDPKGKAFRTGQT